MESKMEEALRAKEKAERLYKEQNLVAAKRYALKAQSLCPGLDGVSQMVATFNVYLASEARVNGEIDYYSILGLKPTVDDNKVKKQYKKMAVLLHPDKNKCVGADGAFKLVLEAWILLSDRAKRSAYDLRRNEQLPSQANLTTSSAVHGNGVVHFDHGYAAPVPHHRLDTFWTVCSSCKVQYEYLRKYLNKKLSCKNCRGVFMAVETGVAPISGSYPFHTWSPMAANGYAGNGVNGVSYYPSSSVLYTGNGVHLGHGSEYSSNLSFQWSSSSKTSSGVVIPNGFSTISTDTIFNTNGKVKIKSKEKRKFADLDISSTKTASVQITSNPSITYRNPLLTKTGKIDKRRRSDTVAVLKSLFEDTGSNTPCEVKPPNAANGATVDHTSKASIFNEPQARRVPVAPPLDIRKILVDKAKLEIAKKLGEMKLAAAKKNIAQHYENVKPLDLGTKSEPISINVPDPDFHDFDTGRSEQCFQAKQIWALYDEEDGMPRLYCMIRQVLSLDPFKMHITYLNSKTSSEFGSVNWVGAGFTKSCGKFKAMHSDIVDQVNIFSHVLSEEIKAGRGGCVRIYPKTGDIWAIYRNWSPDWDSSTPDEVRQQYDMVEVVADYNEVRGVPICPLVKLEGYNTVYRRSEDSNAVRCVPKQEMFRFSHRVPSWVLEGDDYGLPDGCWDLDPAATPDDLLHSVKQPHVTDESKTNLMRKKSSEYVTEPASQGLHYANAQAAQEVKYHHTEGKQHEPQLSDEQIATKELDPYPEVKQDQLHDIKKNAAADPRKNLDVKQHEFSTVDKQVEAQYSAEVKPNQLQFPNGQAAAEELQSYLQLEHNQLPYPTGHVAVEPKLNSEMKQNQNSYANEHTLQAPGPYPTVKQDHYQHGAFEEPKLVFRQGNLYSAIRPSAAEEQSQLSEAEQIELLFRV